jgi:large subunit ribosomal protein L10
MNAKDTKKTHVSEAKKAVVAKLIDLMKKKTVMIVSIKNLPSSQFQDIRKKLRGKADLFMSKKRLIDLALEESKDEHLKDLVKYVQEDRALLFSDDDAFELSGFLSDNKSSAKAKIGQEATDDIQIEAGPTDLIPGPDISALSAVGLQPKVENGKISIVNSHVIVKKGEKINEAQAAILSKLDITPFKIGLEPVVAFYEGKVYEDIKIDKEATLEELSNMFGRSLAFAVSVNHVTNETLTFILGKASSHEGALASLVKEDAPAEEKKDEAEGEKKDDSTEEKKKEEPKADEKPVEETKDEEVKNE